MEEHRLVEGELLNSKQELNEAGYSFNLVKRFNKEVIKHHKLQLKEWDYYYFGNSDYAIALVVGDLRYIGQFGVVLFDFKAKKLVDRSKLLLFPCGKMKIPGDASTSYKYFNKDNFIELIMDKDDPRKRHINVYYKDFVKGQDLNASLDVFQTCKDNMVIATPFFRKKHFYYNMKMNNLKANGKVLLGETLLNPNDDFIGVLDWGRGVWTYINSWNWCSINTTYNGDLVGFNLGNGFGDTKASSENMFFLNEKAYKLKQIEVIFSKLPNGKIDYTGDLRIISFDKSNIEVDITFHPTFNRHVYVNALLIKQVTNQIFGEFTGKVIYNKNVYCFTKIFGFIERVYNRW